MELAVNKLITDKMHNHIYLTNQYSGFIRYSLNKIKLFKLMSSFTPSYIEKNIME